MNRLVHVLAAIAVCYISGCTHGATVRPSVSPVAFELIDQKVQASAAVYVYPELIDHKVTVHPTTYACSAWNFDVEIGDSIRTTVHRVAEAAFKKAYPVSSLNEAVGSYDVIVAISLLDANTNIAFHQSFFSATADASAELNLKVALYDNKKERLDQFVVGYSSRQTGGAGGFCEGGGQVIDAAFQQCLKNISIQLAEKLTRNQRLLSMLQRKP